MHCRAGIGRTGTTIALINSVICINALVQSTIGEPHLSIFSIVRRLREQRIWMVQVPNQYEFIY